MGLLPALAEQRVGSEHCNDDVFFESKLGLYFCRIAGNLATCAIRNLTHVLRPAQDLPVNRLVAAVKRKDAHAWSECYSKEGFLPAISGVDCYTGRSAWVETITFYSSNREYQHLEPSRVRIAPLTSGLALMTSREAAEMGLKDGQRFKSNYVLR